MNAVATPVSLFSGLLKQHAAGTFVLRRILEEHMAAETMSLVMKKVDALYEAYCTTRCVRCVPNFRFQLTEDRVKLEMFHPEEAKRPDYSIAVIDLLPIQDPETRYQVLVLDVDHVALTDCEGCTWPQISERLREVFSHLCCSKIQLIKAHLESLLVLSKNDTVKFTYDLHITQDLIRIVTNRDGREYTHLAVEAE